jgi:hypothetical protein
MVSFFCLIAQIERTKNTHLAFGTGRGFGFAGGEEMGHCVAPPELDTACGEPSHRLHGGLLSTAPPGLAATPIT